MSGWNPWRELRRRAHLILRFGFLHPSRGRIVNHPSTGMRTITLDRRLTPRTRSSVLSHELVHDSWGIFFTADTPPALVEKIEHKVTRESDELMLPVTDLQAWIDRRGGVIHAWEVAEEFDMDEDVCERQMKRCAWGF